MINNMNSFLICDNLFNKNFYYQLLKLNIKKIIIVDDVLMIIVDYLKCKISCENSNIIYNYVHNTVIQYNPFIFEKNKQYTKKLVN